MILSKPAIGVLFDLTILKHGDLAMIEFMKRADPRRLANCLIASGEVEIQDGAGGGRRPGYCIAVDGEARAVDYIRAEFAGATSPHLTPMSMRIIEPPILDQLGLTEDGRVDSRGCLVTGEYMRFELDMCLEVGWGYAPQRVPVDLPEDLARKVKSLRRGSSWPPGSAGGTRRPWWKIWR